MSSVIEELKAMREALEAAGKILDCYLLDSPKDEPMLSEVSAVKQQITNVLKAESGDRPDFTEESQNMKAALIAAKEQLLIQHIELAKNPEDRGSAGLQRVVQQIDDALKEPAINGAEQAYNKAIQFLNSTGKVVWSSEVTGIRKSPVGWLIEITGKTFIGLVIVKFDGNIDSVLDVTKRRP